MWICQKRGTKSTLNTCPPICISLFVLWISPEVTYESVF